MIELFSVTNYLGERIDIDLFNPKETGFAITSITGLGPPKSNVNITGIVTMDGGLFNSARISDRNIVIKIQYQETETENIEDIRLKSYKYFPIKKDVILEIRTKNRTSLIEGFVESNEPDIFSKEEGCTISIVCPSPYFMGKELQSAIFPTASTSNIGTPVINYRGDAETGFILKFTAHASIGNITLVNSTYGGQMFINANKLTAIASGGLSDGDVLEISTIQGKHYARLNRGGGIFNALNAVIKGSTWFKLLRGANDFMYRYEASGGDLDISMDIPILYEGI